MLSSLKKHQGQYRITLVISLVPAILCVFGIGLAIQEYFEKGKFDEGPGYALGGLVFYISVWLVSLAVRWIIDGFKK